MSDFQNDQNRSEILQSPINLTDRQGANNSNKNNKNNNNYDLNNNETFSLASMQEHNNSSESNINNQLVESDTNFNNNASGKVQLQLEEKRMKMNSEEKIDEKDPEEEVHVCKIVVTIMAAFPAGELISFIFQRQYLS